MNFAVFVSVTVVINSTFVELGAIGNHAFNLFTTAPPEYANVHVGGNPSLFSILL